MKRIFMPNMELKTDAFDKTSGALTIADELTLSELLDRYELSDCIVIINGEYKPDEYQFCEGDIIQFIPSGG